MCIESAGAERYAGPGLGYNFGGDDLQVRRCCVWGSLLAWVVGCSRCDLELRRWVAEAVNASLSGKVDAAIGYGWRAEQFGWASVGHGNLGEVESFSGVAAGGDDGEAAVDLGRVESVIGQHGRSLADGADVVNPVYLARLGVERVDVGRVVGDVQAAVVDDWAAIAGEDAVVAPDFVAGGVDAHDAAEGGVVEVFLAVGCVHLVASDDD